MSAEEWTELLPELKTVIFYMYTEHMVQRRSEAYFAHNICSPVFLARRIAVANERIALMIKATRSGTAIEPALKPLFLDVVELNLYEGRIDRLHSFLLLGGFREPSAATAAAGAPDLRKTVLWLWQTPRPLRDYTPYRSFSDEELTRLQNVETMMGVYYAEQPFLARLQADLHAPVPNNPPHVVAFVRLALTRERLDADAFRRAFDVPADVRVVDTAYLHDYARLRNAALIVSHNADRLAYALGQGPAATAHSFALLVSFIHGMGSSMQSLTRAFQLAYMVNTHDLVDPLLLVHFNVLDIARHAAEYWPREDRFANERLMLIMANRQDPTFDLLERLCSDGFYHVSAEFVRWCVAHTDSEREANDWRDASKPLGWQNYRRLCGALFRPSLIPLLRRKADVIARHGILQSHYRRMLSFRTRETLDFLGAGASRAVANQTEDDEPVDVIKGRLRLEPSYSATAADFRAMLDNRRYARYLRFDRATLPAALVDAHGLTYDEIAECVGRLTEAELIDFKGSSVDALRALVRAVALATAPSAFTLWRNPETPVLQHPDIAGYRRFLKVLFAHLWDEDRRDLFFETHGSAGFFPPVSYYPLLVDNEAYVDGVIDMTLPPIAHLTNTVLTYLCTTIDGYACVISAAIDTNMVYVMPTRDYFERFFADIPVHALTRHMKRIRDRLLALR